MDDEVRAHPSLRSSAYRDLQILTAVKSHDLDRNQDTHNIISISIFQFPFHFQMQLKKMKKEI
jgi:hypothetical protein